MDSSNLGLSLSLLLCALTIFFGLSFTVVRSRKTETSRSGGEIKRLDSSTFRVQAVPATLDGRDVTRKDVEELMRKAYNVEEDIQISVGSLARHPTKRAEKVATLSFSRIPDCLIRTSESRNALHPYSSFKLNLDIRFHGLTPLHSHENPGCDLEIVAVSGLNGHAFGSFKERGGDYMWLRDDLCRSLPNARVYIYGYGTEMDGSDSFQTLEDLGISLRSSLKALLKPEDTNRSPNPLVLIGHSLGGLVIKQALCQMSESNVVDEKAILKSLQAVLLFGTPNQGMNIESLLPMVYGQANEQFVRSLGYDSTELRLQAKHWHRVFVEREGDKVSSVFEVFSFYETKNSPTAVKVQGKWTMNGTPTKLVDRNSATHGKPFDGNDHYIQPINRNHSELVKFSSSTDEVYSEIVLPLLQKHYYLAKNRSPVLLLSREIQMELEHCRASLSFREEDSRSGQITVAENNLCTWFTNHAFFRTWLHNDRGLLWLQGLPGAGKSTTMKHAIESTKRNNNNNENNNNAVVISFFIYGLGIDLQKTLLGLYSSLIRQLLLHVPEAFLSLISKAQGKHEPSNWGALELQEHFKQGLIQASKMRPVIIFIDALDEFSAMDEQRHTLLPLLRDLCYGKQYIGLRTKICVSCRYHPHLYNKGLVIPAEQYNGDDISTFVRYSLDDLPQNKKTPLEEHIIKGSNGVFQWARIVCMKALDLHRAGKPLKVIMPEIEGVPQGLHSLYKRLLEEMNERDMSQSLKLFRWVCFSERRLNLRELQHALALAPAMSEQSLAEYTQSENFLEDLEDIKNSIKHLSKGLISFEEPLNRANKCEGWGDYVRLIHVSVMDFLCEGGFQTLERAEACAIPYPPEGSAHYYISRSTLKYMFMRGTRNDFDTSISTDSRFPLDHYAMTSIQFHLKRAEKCGVDQFDLIRLFGWPYEMQAIACFNAFNSNFGQVSLIHMLAGCGIMSALRPLIQYEPGCKPNTQHESEISTILFTNTLQDDVLLTSGQVNLDIRNNVSMTPLHYALQNDQELVAEELLRTKRVDPNAASNQGVKPLHLAAAVGLPSVVQELLSIASVNPNAQQSDGSTALHRAVDTLREDVIGILLRDQRVNQNVSDKSGRTPLHAAVYQSVLGVVEALLESDQINVNAKNRKGQSPLIAFMLGFAGQPDESEIGEFANVLLRLLEHPGIECRARDNMLRTALFHAATEGLDVYARILVERCGGAGDKDKLGRTPLSQAAVKGHLEIVRRFLAAETLNAETLQFAYQKAKEKGREEVMKMLVETGKVVEEL